MKLWDLVAIDPGRSAGVAYYQAGKLTRVSAISSPRLLERDRCRVLVLERPRQYPKSPVRPESNITLAVTAGLLAGRLDYTELVQVHPQEWKGQRPKETDHRYTKKVLEPDELRVALSVGGKKAEDVLDAVGLGLWYIGRR